MEGSSAHVQKLELVYYDGHLLTSVDFLEVDLNFYLELRCEREC